MLRTENLPSSLFDDERQEEKKKKWLIYHERQNYRLTLIYRAINLCIFYRDRPRHESSLNAIFR